MRQGQKIAILAYWKKKSIPSEAGKSESDKEASQDALINVKIFSEMKKV